jgi:hypothetical protein
MEELSFHLHIERSTEFKLAETSEDSQGRAKSRDEGWKELCSAEKELGPRFCSQDPAG